MVNWLLSKLKGDPVIWGIIFFLSLIGSLAVYSSTKMLALKSQQGYEYFLFKHLIIIIFGFLVIFFSHKVNYRYYAGIAKILLPIAFGLMVLTYFSDYSVNQAKRWLPIPGTGLTIQTSDIAKLSLIMFLARAISLKQDLIKDFKKGFLPLMIPILAICLVIAPSDLSTSATLLFTSIVLLFVGRAKIQHIGIIFLIAIIGLSFLVMLAQVFDWEWLRWTTWQARFADYFSGGDGSFQNQQAKIAIAKGGLIGVGPGNSVQRSFLPNPYGDFIYAIIVEEYGAMGGIFLISLYLLLLYRAIRILLKSSNSFGALLAVGLTMSLVIQAMFNMGVAVHLFPNTGLALPLVSMGGTSLIFTCLALGIILSVSAYNEDLKNSKNPVKQKQ